MYFDEFVDNEPVLAQRNNQHVQSRSGLNDGCRRYGNERRTITTLRSRISNELRLSQLTVSSAARPGYEAVFQVTGLAAPELVPGGRT